MKNGKTSQLMQKYSIFFVLLVMIIASTMMNPSFMSTRNMTNIAVQLAVATILAYGEMVLIDLGSAHNHYCADISRTFPVNGKFTDRQKQVYNTVLAAQQLVIDTAKPGMTLQELNQLVIDFYESKLPELDLRGTVRDYYYHGVSHQLGLDTHDICTERERTLKPGMVITVEPGLYIEEEGIGVRIENDILITEDGCIDLSIAIPRTVEEIEALMAK